jgi:YfiR/HmsC-like
MSGTRQIFALLACLALAGEPALPAQREAGENDAKARFLANTPGFVEWPTSSFQTPTTPLLICVHGDFSFGTALAELTRGESIKGRRVEVKWVRNEQNLPGCQVLFVSRSASKRYGRVLDAVKESGALTIGEDPEFLKAGGMLNLEAVPRGLTFDVNLDAVVRGHLKLSSQLLSLARHVFRGTELARG